MRYGDKDGYNEIYDDRGELILHPDEKILVTEENIVPSFKSTWRYYGGEYLLEPSKGTIYLTTERMVFINIPERMFAIGGGDETRAMNAPMEASFELGDISPGAAVREYFEIPNIEIMASEKKEGAVSVGEMVNVFILSSGNQYHLSMVLTEDSGLLMRLMNKEVDSLDTLVNNLKDFFRRTDWMFTEGEKRLYGSIPKPEKDTMKKKALSEPKGPAKQPAASAVDAHPRTEAPSPPPVRIERRFRPTEDVSTKSMEYFENLYRKGLIREEVYNKLITQNRMFHPPVVPLKKTPEPAGKDEGVPPADEAPKDVEPEKPEGTAPPPAGEEKAPDTGDVDLLDMLNSTLSSLDETGDEKNEPSSEGEEKKKVAEVRAKKVHKKIS